MCGPSSSTSPLRDDGLQESLASSLDVVVGPVEIAGVPGVRDLPSPGVLHQHAHPAAVRGRCERPDVLQVATVHAYDVIICSEIRVGDPPGPLPFAGNPVL